MKMKSKTISLPDILKVLSKELNLEILAFTDTYDELCVCDFEELINAPQPTISRHLKELLDVGLVAVRQEGRWRYYSPSRPYEPFIKEIIELAKNEYAIEKKELKRSCH
ncbi:MAG: transcriptional regulator [Thermotogae bacterium]|nr:MAG: transcriptional regulator [Thermotogota bacterium]